METHTQSACESLQDKLLRLPCHFSWESLQNENVGRTVEMNIDNLEEHIHEAIQGTEVKSYNLMGFYKTQQEQFQEARTNFQKALTYSESEDDKIVSLGCQAWLTWKSSSDSSSDEQVAKMIEQLQNILHGRNSQGIPEVMAEKAFAIANSGFNEKGFKEALDCIDKALEKRPDDVMYKFTKVILLKHFYLKEYKKANKDDADAKKIEQHWEGLIESLAKNSSRYPVLHGQTLIHYAIFLNQIHSDCGASGMKYAEEAEKIARDHQATAVMRNVARFYLQTARNCWSSSKRLDRLNKAEAILEEILESKSDGNYKELTNLANCHLMKYEMKSSSSDSFDKAEQCFLDAWKLNKKYSSPALDLVRLYQIKYDKTKDVSALGKAEKILQELFLDYERKEDLEKARICSAFGRFMKAYGKKLASFYRQSCPGYQSASAGSARIEKALQQIHQYTKDKEDEHLLEAEQIFKQLYNNWEELKDPVKARFHKEYAAFLDNYSSDLALCYLTKCLEHNPHLRLAYAPLQELARDKIACQNKKEQIKGHRTLKWIAHLQAVQEEPR